MAYYGYVRVSTTEQADGTSLAEQERRVRAVAAFYGREVREMFVDAGVSGSVPLNERPQGYRLGLDIHRGDTIIASKMDRMFRSASDALATMERFRDMGVKLILCDMGMEPVTENGVSKLLFGILASMAEFERERINERCREGQDAKRAAGGWLGGKPPFGFMIEGSGKSARCVPDPALADAVADIRRCWENGTSLRGASQYLSGKGVRVSFNQVHRVYQKFDYDRAEEAKRDVERSACTYVHRKE
jgi:DNA invertase Pin-like site-specific DNA recombinase